MSEKIELPKGWEVVNLKSITDSIQYGYTESSSKEEVGPKFLRITDIQNNKVDWSNVPYCKIDTEVKKKYLLKDGDLLFARTGATVGKSFLIKGNIPETVFASYLIRVRVNKEINDNYLLYFFYSPNYWGQITDEQVGTGQPNVNGTTLGQLKIPLPTLSEQAAIVSKLEELLSDLENGKQQLLTAQAQLKVYRQSLLKWAFEGKLTNKKVKEGELPKGWKMVELGSLFKQSPQNGLYKPATDYGSGTRIIRIDGFYEGVIVSDYDYKRVRLDDSEIEKYKLEIDDVLINRVNSMSHLGKCGLVKSLIETTVFESNIMRFKVDKNTIIPLFLTTYLSSIKGIRELVKNAKNAVNQASINQTDVSNATVPLPPLSEQTRIVEELESKLTICDKIAETISQSLLQAETLRQSILKKAFEGRLV